MTDKAAKIAELSRRAVSIAARDGVLDMQFADRAAVNGAIDILRSQQLEVEAVMPTTSTLEEVFIRSVNG